MAKKRKEYILTDGQKYIRENINGRFMPTTNLSLASVFDRVASAEGILRNAVPFAIRKDMYVAEIINGNVIRVNFDIARPEKFDKTNNSNKTIKFDYKDEKLDKVIKVVSDFEDLIKVSEHRCSQIMSDLQEIDKEKDEIIHAIEGRKVNACQACKLTLELQKVLRKRRYIKNELQVIKAISKTNTYKAELMQILDDVKALGDQEYRPCIRPDLFV